MDTDQWLAAAKALGARYAYITPTHMNGFLQWQSDLYPYGVKQSSWRNGKGDLIKEFVESCRRYDIEPCLFFGLRFNAYWGVSRHLVDWGKGEDKARQARYVKMCEQMMTELCTRYGKVVAVWFDGGARPAAEGGPDALGIVTKHQPQAEFYRSPERMDHRWIGNEGGYAGYPCWATIDNEVMMKAYTCNSKIMPGWRRYMAQGDPEGKSWSPGMVDVPLRNHDWFWGPGREHTIYPLNSLVKMYYESVGRNCTLVLGVTPDNRGLVPEPDVKRMEELGNEIRRRFGTPLAETKGNGSTVKLSLHRPSVIDHVIIMEDIAQGERIRKYIVEGLVEGGKWQKLCEGISVGHKRIQQFIPIEVSKIRVAVQRVSQSR